MPRFHVVGIDEASVEQLPYRYTAGLRIRATTLSLTMFSMHDIQS